MRIEQLTFTRFLAAISIVIFHFGQGVFPFNHSFIFSKANIGVSYFFILSGFVMIVAYGDRNEVNVFEYLKSRIARIYPNYIFAILLMGVYFIFANTNIDDLGLLLNLFMIQAWIPDKALSFNAPGWSLSIEFFFYLLFPWLFNRFYSKVNSQRIGIFIISIWIVSQVVTNLLTIRIREEHSPTFFNFLYYFPIIHLNEFLLVNMAGILLVKMWRSKQQLRSSDCHCYSFNYPVV